MLGQQNKAFYMFFCDPIGNSVNCRVYGTLGSILKIYKKVLTVEKILDRAENKIKLAYQSLINYRLIEMIKGEGLLYPEVKKIVLPSNCINYQTRIRKTVNN